MHAADLLPWPRFVMRSITCPVGTPDEVRQVLGMHGVPERGVGGEYIALNSAVILDDAPNLLAFGQSGLDGRICMDLISLAVVHVPDPGAAVINPANSSLATFSACIQAAIVRFPYYTYEMAEDLGEEVASSLRGQLLAIDQAVGAHNGLWETFLDDVAMGNYAEEEYEQVAVGGSENSAE